ncbi:MAG: CYTH domain-containing protein [Ruminococcus sp.]
MGEPLEIERKWLIEYPNVEELSKMEDYDYTEIWQTYTDYMEHNAFGRIRKRGKDGKYTYTKTFKRKISDLTRVEYEEEITPEEYKKIMEYRKKGYNTINKVRHTFMYKGFKYEVDVFPFWDDRAFLECEVDSEDTEIPIPDCVKVIKEVSFDPRYKNSVLAQKIIREKI